LPVYFFIVLFLVLVLVLLGFFHSRSSTWQPHEVALKRDPTDDRPRSIAGRAKLAEPFRAL
jgi:hypothetical protein